MQIQVDAPAPANAEVEEVDTRAKESLLAQTAKAQADKPEETEQQRQLKEEEAVLREITVHKALKGVNEIAKVRQAKARVQV